MPSTHRKTLRASAPLVALTLTALWLTSARARAAEQDQPSATANKTMEKAAQGAAKETDDPFAPANQVETRATAIRDGKRTPIDERINVHWYE